MNFLEISNGFCVSWLRYETESSSTSASVTHLFPIVYNTVYNIQSTLIAVGNTNYDVRYFNPSLWTNSDVTFRMRTSKFVLIIGEI